MRDRRRRAMPALWRARPRSGASPGAASTARTTRAVAPPKLTQLGHVTLWECKARTTEMLVAVNTLTGTWNQAQANSTARVPAGAYTLVVNDRHFSFPLHVVAH